MLDHLLSRQSWLLIPSCVVLTRYLCWEAFCGIVSDIAAWFWASLHYQDHSDSIRREICWWCPYPLLWQQRDPPHEPDFCFCRGPRGFCDQTLALPLGYDEHLGRVCAGSVTAATFFHFSEHWRACEPPMAAVQGPVILPGSLSIYSAHIQDSLPG